jgi:hypothetical protein
MKKISSKNQKIFIDTMKQELIKIKAEPFISDPLQFDLKTKYGILWLRIDTDQSSCFSVFGRFVEVSKVKYNLFDNINSYSGKWNHHLIEENPKNAVNQIINNYKFLIN